MTTPKEMDKYVAINKNSWHYRLCFAMGGCENVKTNLQYYETVGMLLILTALLLTLIPLVLCLCVIGPIAYLTGALPPSFVFIGYVGIALDIMLAAWVLFVAFIGRRASILKDVVVKKVTRRFSKKVVFVDRPV